MKKIITIILAMVLGLFCFGAQGCDKDTKTLHVYTKAGFEPYEYISASGKVVGVDMDIMREIGEVLGYNVVINDIEFDQIFMEIQNSEYAVGAAGITKTDARDKIALSSIPYTTSTQYVIVPKGEIVAGDLVSGKLSLGALIKLSKKTIGFQRGTTGEHMVVDAINGTEKEGVHITGELEGKGISSISYDSAVVASKDIGSLIGAVVIDEMPAKSITNANANLECFELDAIPEQYVLYFNKNATELVVQVNKVLEKMIENGVIDYFTLKHSGSILD